MPSYPSQSESTPSSLERIGTVEATELFGEVFRLDRVIWRWQARKVVRRMGPRLLPAAITQVAHEDASVRAWARWVQEELGAGEPGRLVPELDQGPQADVIRAYARARRLDAMRVTVSYVASERRPVRRAARWAMEQYGRNAIWILREAYHHRTGEHASREWGPAQTRTALFQAVDRARLEPVREALEAGRAAAAAGDLEGMGVRYDQVLLHAPELPEGPEIGAGYASLAAQRLAADDLDGAERAYRRALRLAPESEDANAWRAQLLFIDAERSLTAGVLDVDGYRRVLALDAEHEGAGEALDAALGGASLAADPRGRLGLGAAAVLSLLGFALLWRRRRNDASVEEAIDSTMEDELDTLADQTLPG